MDNIGDRACIGGADVPSTEIQAVGINTLPDTWAYTLSGVNYVFQDIAILCDTACNISYQYCPYDCDVETSRCLRNPTAPEGEIRDIIVQGYWWFAMLFPTSVEQTFIYILITIALSGAVAYGVGHKSQDAGTIFLGLSILFVGVGTIIPTITAPFIPFFITFVYVILAGWLLLRAWRGGI